MTKKPLFFTSKKCSPCVSLKKKLKTAGINYRKNVREIDADSDSGAKLADKLNVRYVPSIVKDGKELSGADVIRILKGG